MSTETVPSQDNNDVYQSERPGHWIIPHGSYSAETRYRVKKLNYAAGDGYLELLEMFEKPQGHGRYILHHFAWPIEKCFFAEFDSEEGAKEAFSNFFSSGGMCCQSIVYHNIRGFRRFVYTGEFQPWFYATGTKPLVKNRFAFPENLVDDEQFKTGMKFLVKDTEQGSSTYVIRKILGASKEFKARDKDVHGDTIARGMKRILYWSNGTSWTGFNACLPPAIPDVAGFQGMLKSAQPMLLEVEGKILLKRCVAKVTEKKPVYNIRAQRDETEDVVTFYWNDFTYLELSADATEEKVHDYHWETAHKYIFPRTF